VPCPHRFYPITGVSADDTPYITTLPGPWLYSALQLGGGFAYNHRSNQCQSSVEFNLDAVPDQPGFCAQIASASDNPGYNPDARPAPPLKKVFASKGSC